MARLIPFPGSRQVGFARTHSRVAAGLSPQKAEEHIAREVKRRGECLVRKGVPADLVAVEMKALEGAIRAELWRRVLTPGGAA